MTFMLLINVQEASKNKKFSNNIMSNSTCNCGGSGHCNNCGSGACVRLKDKNINLESIYRAK